MKKILGLLLTGLIFNFVFTQNYQDDFQKYSQTKDTINQLKTLTEWEKSNPKDYIILSNIAQGYKLKGDKKKAIKYYKKTIKYGDEQAKMYAKQQIDKFKK